MSLDSNSTFARQTAGVFGARIDALSWDAALDRLLGNGSDMATPDGAPVAWMLRRPGFSGQPRIGGPDVMWALCGDVAMLGK